MSTARAGLAELRRMPGGLDRLFDGGGTGWRRRGKVRVVPADRLLPPLVEAAGCTIARLVCCTATASPSSPAGLISSPCMQAVERTG